MEVEMMFCSLLRFIAPHITPAAPCLSYPGGELTTHRMGPGLVADTGAAAPGEPVISGVRENGSASHSASGR